MSGRVDYPHWAYPSRRAFMAQKRRELDAAIRAVDEAFVGCAYLPSCNSAAYRVRTALRELRESIRVAKVGR